MPATPPRADTITASSWLLAAIGLIGVLELHLVPALFAGLLVYELIHIMAPLLARRLFREGSRLAAVGVLSIIVVATLTLLVFGAVAFFRSDAGSLTGLAQRMADIIDGA